MTIRNPPSLAELPWPGELRPAPRPLTPDFLAKLPPGPPFYQLIEGNLILRGYTGTEALVRPDQPVTDELFSEIPEGPPYYELIDGIIVMSPTPRNYRQKIAGRLYYFMEDYLDNNPIGEVFIAPSEVCLDEGYVLEPDIYYIRNENRRLLANDKTTGAPDLVVEILSPSNFREDREIKRPAYARASVQEMWIVDPEARQIEVYPLALGVDVPPTIIHEPDTFHPALFPGLAIDTVRLFKPLVTGV